MTKGGRCQHRPAGTVPKGGKAQKHAENGWNRRIYEPFKKL